MLSYKQILEYAVKGITAEIENLEKDVKQGYKFIDQIDNGEIPKIKKSKYEILDICQEKNNEIKKLEKECFELRWEISELDQKCC